MRFSRFLIAVFFAASAAGLHAQAPKTAELGSITFPTSAKPAAQGPFLTGVKALYNFEFDTAAESSARRRRPTRSSRSVWGEAMSFNHPLWAQQDLAAARKVMERLAPTAAERAAKAPAGKERDLIEAQEILSAPATSWRATSPTRRRSRRWSRNTRPTMKSRSCTRCRCSVPLRPGVNSARQSMQAAAIAVDVFQRHPQHPGAAHFIIHSFDDPDPAILALPAARAYAKIAPSAAHALHMPSHIFVQLGLWDDVIASNVVAYKAADDIATRMSLPRGREDFHTLSWLQYGYLQEGKFDEAAKALATAKAVADKDPSPGVANGYASMKARQVVETLKWEKLPLPTGAVREGGAPGYDGNAAYIFAAGFSAAHLDDLATANAALEKLKAMRTQAETGSNAYRAKPFAIMEKELEAAIAFLMKKDMAAAERSIKEATAIELTLDAPSGPAEPIAPSFESRPDTPPANRPAEAAEQFQASLKRMPNRRFALEGLKRATTAKSTTSAQGR